MGVDQLAYNAGQSADHLEGHLLDKGVWCAGAGRGVYCGKTNTTQLFEHLKKKLCFHLHSQSEALRRVMQQG
jgi:hypothetical protein